MADLQGVGGGDAGEDTFDVNSVISKFQSQLLTGTAPAEGEEGEAAADEAPAAEETTQEEPAAEEAPKEQAPAAKDAAAPKEEPKPDLRAKQLAALARREAALAQKEAALDQKVKEAVEQARAELRGVFVRDPARFAQEVGVAKDRLGQYATLLWGAELGEDATPEVRAQLAHLQMQARLEAIEQSQKPKQEKGEPEHTPEFRVQVAMADREIKGLVADPPADLPFLAAEIESDPEAALQAMYAVAGPAIKAGRWPTAREVARALEDQLRSDYERLDRAAKRVQTKSDPNPKPTTKSEKKAPATSLSDADTTSRPDRKPPGLLSDEEYYQRAMAVAKKQGLIVKR